MHAELARQKKLERTILCVPNLLEAHTQLRPAGGSKVRGEGQHATAGRYRARVTVSCMPNLLHKRSSQRTVLCMPN